MIEEIYDLDSVHEVPTAFPFLDVSISRSRSRGSFSKSGRFMVWLASGVCLEHSLVVDPNRDSPYVKPHFLEKIDRIRCRSIITFQ